ncbi:MAG: hypothetical protein KAS94_11945 [Desulfobulbaceae bacterium]|nr:hypothetical protein [Desulfobulbaceae bacterium]
MKDLPITSRIAILIGLLLSLAGLLRQIVVEPTGGLSPEVIARSEGESAEQPAPPEVVLYPPVPAVLPDLNDGYLFNSERQFEELELDTARGGNGTVDLADVTYAGSLIVGEIYKGLIVYQEKVPVARSAARSSLRAARARKTAARAVSKYKQLDRGEKFMGYLVEKIEKDRIVFRQGDEVVEKFLYDPNKNRVALSPAAKSKAAKATPPATRAAQRTPVQRTVSRPAPHTTKKTADAKARRMVPSSDTQPAAARLIKSRSERLLGLDPSLSLPRSPGIPGDPLRR